MSQREQIPVVRPRRVLIGLAVLFFAPLALAFYLYYGLDWRPGGHVNQGDLIDPPRPLPELVLPRVGGDATGGGTTRPDFLKRKWTLLYWGPGSCPARCRTDLYNTRQVRTALGRDMSRVQRVFVADGDCCDTELLRTQHPDLITVRATPEAAPLLGLLRASDPGAVHGSRDEAQPVRGSDRGAADRGRVDADRASTDPASGASPDGASAEGVSDEGASAEGASADRIYLIDPLGNLMMSYAPDAKPKGMLQDLKRLLGLSSVG
jgi:cytochrome oxidase Cu insertion factor (SCO1/SenC/PrrC family)